MAFGGFLNPVIPKEAEAVATGAVVGSFVPGLGTGIGAAAGGAAATALSPSGAPSVPSLADARASAAERLRQRRFAAALLGRGSTILTGARGLLSPPNVGRALLFGG